MMMSCWVAIEARTANKLSPPCLKGNALPILKMLPGFLELRLHANDGKTTVTFAAVFCRRTRLHYRLEPLRNLRTQIEAEKLTAVYAPI